jgi:primosomal protein N' (replication factor Y)
LNHYSELLGQELKRVFGKMVLGPESPVISRVQSWHIKIIMIKIIKGKNLTKAKQLINKAIEKTEKEKKAYTLRIAIDVDPY